MSRTIDIERRDALVALVADHLVASGTVRGSLREIAPAAGASARMLVHHFGSRDVLIGAALERVREQQLAAARAAIVPGPDAIHALRAAWSWFGRADTRRFFALFEDVESLKLTQIERSPAFRGRLSTDWRPLFEAVFAADVRYADEAAVLAHLVVVAFRGFARDLAAGAPADAAEQQAAFEVLVEMIASR